jgi:uncharacterized repeat protein (TIGR01451 family)
MKKLATLIVILAFGWINQVHAQITNYLIYNDSIIGCQNTLNVVVYQNSGSTNETGQVEINWGDGTADNYPFTIVNSGINLECSHSYTTAGNYNAEIQVYSNSLSDYFDAGQIRTLTSLSQSYCGHFAASVYQNSPSFQYADAPISCTGANGNVTILSPNSYYYANYFGLDPSNAPYQVKVDDAWLLTNGYIQVSPNQTITSFDASGLANNTNMNFEISCNTSALAPDFSVAYFFAINFVAPLQIGYINALICNNACSNTSNVSVSMNFPAGFAPVTTNLTNPVVTGNNLTFDILNLSSCAQLSIPFTFPGATPAGTEICFDIATINSNDSYLPNNTATTCTIVRNSFDPNAKEVDHLEQINPDELETLKYMIHFQNDGNFDALNVQIVDTISENLNLQTFKLLGSKHGVSVNINDVSRIVTFTFPGCNLSPSSSNMEGSKGYVVYSISEMSNLPLGSIIDNTAYIYFDFNSPIVTNTTHNVNQYPLGLNESKTELVTLYPNPAQDKIQFSGASVNEVYIYDLTGKLVLEASNILNNEVSVNPIQTGIYQVILKTENNVSTQKLVIKK